MLACSRPPRRRLASPQSACLAAPDGSVYLIGGYGYTQDLRGDGWQAFGLDQQTDLQPNEHDAGDTALEPAACATAYALVNAAYTECYADHPSALECEHLSGFSDVLVSYLPMCP